MVTDFDRKKTLLCNFSNYFILLQEILVFFVPSHDFINPNKIRRSYLTPSFVQVKSRFQIKSGLEKCC